MYPFMLTTSAVTLRSDVKRHEHS